MVCGVADPLHSARVKFRRANLHASTTEREARRFLDKHPAPPIEVKPKADPGILRIGDTVDLVLAFVEGAAYPDLPESFPARFGDAIQNYRSALDHIAWQLVKHGSTPKPKNPTAVQFPIFTRESDFRAKVAARLPGVSRAPGGPCDFIHFAHGYRRGKAHNEILLLLNKLSNDDKHRALHTTVAALHGARHQSSFTHCRPIAFDNPPVPPTIKPGAEIAHLRVVVTGPDPEVEMEPKLSGYIALEGWTNAIDVLKQMRAEIGAILNAPQITDAFMDA
jgi:hypothetical protein